MTRRVFLSSLLIMAANASADSATQTDWSGGGGVPGPVITLGNNFDVDTNCHWSTPGLLHPSIEVVEWWIDHFVGYPGPVFPVDIDGDGDQDVAGASFDSGPPDIIWWENTTGQGTDWIQHTVEDYCYQARGMAASDVDGDGDMDLFGSDYMTHKVFWWENTDGSGGMWTEHFIAESVFLVESIDSSDVDGDGDPDLMAVAMGDNELLWFENFDGQGNSWVEHILVSGFSPVSIRSADIDADGDQDAVVTGDDLNLVRWYENIDGAGLLWTPHDICTGMNSPRMAKGCDVDQDGDLDVATVDNRSGGVISWQENLNGSGTQWAEHTVDYFSSPYDIDFGDYDNDGDMDCSTIALSGENWLPWWENTDGIGQTWEDRALTGDFSGRTITSCDLNSDGRTDVVAARYLKHDVRFFDVRSLMGYVESSILDTQGDPDWGWLDWTCSEPSGSSVAMQVRASDDHTVMGAWSDTLYSPCSLEGILSDNDSYIQYRTILVRSQTGENPLLYDVTISWNPVCISENTEPVPACTALFQVSPNPTAAPPLLAFALLESAPVEISVFDLAGRRIHTSADDYQAGYHSLFLSMLSPGVYYCRMTSGDFIATERFVVIE